MSSLTKDGLLFKNISFRKRELVAKWLLRKKTKTATEKKQGLGHGADWVIRQRGVFKAHYNMQDQDQNLFLLDF